MIPYKLSPLTNTELIDLHETLYRLGLLLSRLQDLHIFPEEECVDLEALLEVTYTEIELRALEDTQPIPGRRLDDD